ncbi:caspase family protein [Desulfococcaceae bacterium HSG9]|nr:caspase family protein [Desulfococcaceae bacterium HSG9]
MFTCPQSSSGRFINFIKFIIFFISTIPIVCFASSWGPQTGVHGSGISRETHPKGLPYPSFNNYTDTNKKTSENNDERMFLLVKNKMKGSKYSTNNVSAKPGDIVFTRAFVHNNGYQTSGNTTAHNVKIRMSGLMQRGNFFVSQTGTDIILKQTISASNSKPSSIWDTVTIKSASGNPIKLQFVGGEIGLTISDCYGKKYTKLSAAHYFGKGVSIGGVNNPTGESIRGDIEDAMYIFTYFKVVDSQLNPTDTLQSTTSVDKTSQNYHALIIGNNNYKELQPLQNAVNDARVIADILKTKYDFTVRLITDATRKDIVLALDESRGKLTQNDNFLIYYAGHGVIDEKINRGYWLPVDASPTNHLNWISNSDITDTLKAVNAKHVLVVADSCYSGTLLRSIKRIKLKTGSERQIYLKRLSDKRSRTALVSGGLEPVTDSGAVKHSIFAQSFIESLQESQNAITAEEVSSFVRKKVIVNAHQTPEYSDIRFAGHNGGDFIFIPK